MPETLRLYPEPDHTLEGVARTLREGRTTCAAVLEYCFRQIDVWDERVQAWVFVDRAGAMRRARELDDQRKLGNDPGPLCGIPIGVKDIVDVAGMPTAAGIKPWQGKVASSDAPLVKALRDAGAVILGKTVTTQFAWVDPPATRNPWNLQRTPGGSSSGSAAALASGMCLAAIGTQTGGSIIRPSSYCGVFGYKPPHGVVSAVGVVPLAPSLDHPGVMARSVADLERVARVISDGGDLGSETPEPAAPTLLRLRGLIDERTEPQMARAVVAALALFAKLGARVEDRLILLDNAHCAHRIIMASEAASSHETRYAQHRGDYRPHIRELVEEGLKLRAVDYVNACDYRERFILELHSEVFGSGSPEAVILPAAPGPAGDLTTTGDPVFNSPWSLTGDPVVSIPVGLSSDGLPLAVQLVGRGRAGVASLFSVARWCERVLRDTGTGAAEG